MAPTTISAMTNNLKAAEATLGQMTPAAISVMEEILEAAEISAEVMTLVVVAIFDYPAWYGAELF